MSDPRHKFRWFYPTPGWLVYGLLAMTGFLFLSERLEWFAFDHHKGWAVLIAVGGVLAAIVALFLWLCAALLFRCRFQFSIRFLLVLVVGVALPFNWLAAEMKEARRQKAAYEASRSAAAPSMISRSVRTACIGGGLPQQGFVWRMLGDDFFGDITEASVTVVGEPTRPTRRLRLKASLA